MEAEEEKKEEEEEAPPRPPPRSGPASAPERAGGSAHAPRPRPAGARKARGRGPRGSACSRARRALNPRGSRDARPRPRLTVSGAAPGRLRSELLAPRKWSWKARKLRSQVRLSAPCPQNPLICRTRCRLKPARRGAKTALHLGTCLGTAPWKLSHLAAQPLGRPATGRTTVVLKDRRRLSAAVFNQTDQTF